MAQMPFLSTDSEMLHTNPTEFFNRIRMLGGSYFGDGDDGDDGDYGHEDGHPTPPEVVAAMASETYAAGVSSTVGGSCCPVCLDDFETGAELMVLPCSHRLHPGCVEPWLKTHDICPVCRRVVYDKEAHRARRRAEAESAAGSGAGSGAGAGSGGAARASNPAAPGGVRPPDQAMFDRMLPNLQAGGDPRANLTNWAQSVQQWVQRTVGQLNTQRQQRAARTRRTRIAAPISVPLTLPSAPMAPPRFSYPRDAVFDDALAEAMDELEHAGSAAAAAAEAGTHPDDLDAILSQTLASVVDTDDNTAVPPSTASPPAPPDQSVTLRVRLPSELGSVTQCFRCDDVLGSVFTVALTHAMKGNVAAAPACLLREPSGRTFGAGDWNCTLAELGMAPGSRWQLNLCWQE